MGAKMTYQGPIGAGMPCLRTKSVADESINVDPFYVCMQRFNGIERRIVACTTAMNEREAIALASQECEELSKAYNDAVDVIIEHIGLRRAVDALQAARLAEREARSYWNYCIRG